MKSWGVDDIKNNERNSPTNQKLINPKNYLWDSVNRKILVTEGDLKVKYTSLLLNDYTFVLTLRC